jgi:hypothetical protein
MTILPEELEKLGYTLLDKLEHSELIPFVQIYSKKKTKASIAFKLINLLFLVIIALAIGRNLALEYLTIGDALIRVCYGFSIAFLLLPIHEYIHAVAYKYVGAKNTSYDANWKKFYFMAIADKFVANRREFGLVALAPFSIITVAFLISALFANNAWALTFMGVLLAHSAFCSGDFALLSYFEFHKEKEVITFDDKENKISYFYSKQSAS